MAVCLLPYRVSWTNSLQIFTLFTLSNQNRANLGAQRWGSTACERALRYQVGEKIHGFTVNQVHGEAVPGGGDTGLFLLSILSCPQ